jgi:hypothetical protein
MQETLYVGLDVHKASISVTVAEDGRGARVTAQTSRSGGLPTTEPSQIGTEGDPEFSTRSHKTNASSQNVQQFVQHNVQRGPLMNLQVILFRCKIPGCDALRAAIEAPHPLHLHAMPDAWPGI